MFIARNTAVNVSSNTDVFDFVLIFIYILYFDVRIIAQNCHLKNRQIVLKRNVQIKMPVHVNVSGQPLMNESSRCVVKSLSRLKRYIFCMCFAASMSGFPVLKKP